jgi:glutamate-1-semialdehyde 2,1-aminomutase
MNWIMTYSTKVTQDLYTKAKRIIPGGTQLLSKRPEMFAPGQWPAYYKTAKGVNIVDMDGNSYIDMCYMGIGSCTLGYADPDVNHKVVSTINDASMCTLNSPMEIELAELLCEIHPWAESVKYARSGGEAMAIATRIARAASGKDKVMFCGYHGWHDWYLSSNMGSGDALGGWHLLPGLDPLGIPKGLVGTSIPFEYNNTETFKELLDQNDGEVGVVIVETIRNIMPDPKFFAEIRSACDKKNIVFILDEITSGFRLNAGGAHLLYGIEPDMAVFAKTMSNGFPMAALIGKRNVMEYAQSTFISSLNWTESVGPAAALATINKMQSNPVFEHTSKLGLAVQDLWIEAGEAQGLKIKISGPVPQLSLFIFEDEEASAIKTLYIQEMLELGYLSTTAFYPSWAHTDEHIKAFERDVNYVFKKIADILKKGDLHSALKGEICHSGFNRL